MSEDPISKSQIGAGLGRPDVLSKSQGRGSVYTDKDYSKSLQSRRSRVAFVTLCLIPYVAACVVLYLDGLEFLAITLLATPLVLLLVFWYIAKRLKY